MKTVIYGLWLIIILLAAGCGNQNKNVKEHSTVVDLSGEYVGQKSPGMVPEVFAPELVSTQYTVRDAAFSPVGNEFFYSFRGPSFFALVYLKKNGDNWTSPEVAPFSGKYSDIEPRFSPDGDKLYFVSNRPLDGISEPKNFDIWYVDKLKDGWGKPQNLGAPINNGKEIYYPSMDCNGTLYFCANYDGGYGDEDIYYSKLVDGKYQQPVNMGDSINSPAPEFNPFIASDGSYLIYTTMGFGNGQGGGDLWISFNKGKDKWTKPINMGPNINTEYLEYCPYITLDGKYLFFSSNRTDYQPYSKKPLTYSDIVKRLNTNQNGNMSIYWVSAKVIETLRPSK